MLPLVQEAWTPEARDRTLVRQRGIETLLARVRTPPTTTSPSLWDRTLIFLHSRRHSLGLLRYPCAMPSGTRGENPVAIAHLHTTLNKSRDEKLIADVPEDVCHHDGRCTTGNEKK